MNILHSVNSFNEAKQVISGGVNSPVRAFGSVGGTPRFIHRGNGSYIYDVDDNKYIDFVQSWGPLIFGHRDMDIENAIKSAIERGLSFGAPTELETTLAKEIISCYKNVDKIRMVSSGTEAVMSAIRLARAYSGKDDILKFDGCYHGHSDSLLVNAGSGCVTFGVCSSLGVLQDISKHTLVARYNDMDSVRECCKNGNVGCIIIEPIAGNMGLVPSDKDFIVELREFCTKENIVLIFDEVMSGFRASLGGASQIYGISGDLTTFGKVVGGGMPLACFGGKAEIMDLLSPTGGVYQAGTLSGNPVAVSAGIAAITKIKRQKGIYEKLESLAKMLMDGFSNAASESGIALQTCVRGSMFGFFFNQEEVKNFEIAKKSDTEMFSKFHNGMLEKGVYLAPSAFEAGFICDCMDEAVINEAIASAREVFKEIK